MLTRNSIAGVLVASALVAGFAVSTQSYWIDEALSLIVAQAPNPAAAWQYMQTVSGSTLQMPLYELYLYLWHKVFGGGEWIMRASNVPWFMLGQVAFLILLRDRPRLALVSCLLAAVSPMLWTYLDETRPYIMQYAAACWLTAALAKASQSEAPGIAIGTAEGAALFGALLVLFASSLLGGLWACGFAAAFWCLRIWTRVPNKDPMILIAAASTSLLILLFAAYYFFTWGDAKRGYQLSGTPLLSLPLIGYDMFGFSGLGPGKISLRSEPLRSLIHSLPTLAPLAAVVLFPAATWFAEIRRRQTGCHTAIAWLFALVLPTAAIFCAFHLQGHRPLPRHFIPVLPALLLALATGIRLMMERNSVFWRTSAILLPLLWLGSSLSLRLNPMHAKDDYESAAKVAADALRSGASVWWAADAAAAFIYGTPIALVERSSCAWGMQAPMWDSIRFKIPPDFIILNRPDVYDPSGSLSRFAAEHNLLPIRKFQGMTVFAREGLASPQQ